METFGIEAAPIFGLHPTKFHSDIEEFMGSHRASPHAGAGLLLRDSVDLGTD